jgi:magnesium chelatase subunit D
MNPIAVEQWQEARGIARCIAVDPIGLGGVLLRARAGPVRDAWLAELKLLLPTGTPVKHVPLHIADGRLVGGLDLAATLAQQKPVAERGVLVDANGGLAVLAMAERMPDATAARVVAAMDNRYVCVERDGVSANMATRFGVVVLDEGADETEAAPAALADRVAFQIDLSAMSVRDVAPLAKAEWNGEHIAIAAARVKLSAVRVDDDTVAAICAASVAFGIASLRAPLLALRVARVLAALAQQDRVDESNVALAVRWVFASRATMIPATEESNEESDEQNDDRLDDAEAADEKAESENPEESNRDPHDTGSLEDVVLEAVKAAIPADLLTALQSGAMLARVSASGRAGVARQSLKRGRPIGARRGSPRDGVRVSVLDTLRAAAPWQKLRGNDPATAHGQRRVEIRREDFHVARFKLQTESTIIFVVDASGSAALHRLAEAKGAVELLLADCYVRRDRVALISFRGRAAGLLLPPTRSLVRAKRGLAGLPGGGATPLASAIDLSHLLAAQAARRGETPTVVFLSDGRANMSRDGTPGRMLAETEAISAARVFAAARFATLFIDTAPQPHAAARAVAAAMRAQYIALPYADAGVLARTVRGAALAPQARHA